MVSPALSRVWQHIKLSDVSLRTRPRYSLVVDEDVKKANIQITHLVGQVTLVLVSVPEQTDLY